MHGPNILATYLSTPSEPDKYGNPWQYNSRSDRHSKVGCWGVAFDLLATSRLMALHATEGKIVLGVNHAMRDFETNRQKDLDLVIARPKDKAPVGGQSFRSLANRYGVVLNDEQRAKLHSLPDIPVGPVAAVLIALEAKAAMTAHQKARPRLYDELNSSHLCVHGASEQALAIAYVQINASEKFVSSVSNPFPLSDYPVRISLHKQPSATQGIIDKVSELPRRSSVSGKGFDAIGVTVLDFVNDGTPVRLVEGPPAPQSGAAFHYDDMIVRMAHEYDTRFARI